MLSCRVLCRHFPSRAAWMALALLAALALGPAPRAALAAPASQDDLARLAELSGGTQMAAGIFTLMQQHVVATMRQKHPDLPEYVFTVLQEEFQREQATFTREIAVVTGQAWGRYLNADEVREMIRLYEQPVMRKVVGLMPRVMADSQELGRRIGADMAGRVLPRVFQRLKDEHGLDLRTKK